MVCSHFGVAAVNGTTFPCDPGCGKLPPRAKPALRLSTSLRRYFVNHSRSGFGVSCHIGCEAQHFRIAFCGDLGEAFAPESQSPDPVLLRRFQVDADLGLSRADKAEVSI